ncbi:hypothetical protein CPC08DRAFT_168393 [Agrocybe pediades]|nr:hypothetical protein CPC08DRAFT_168393 [Agrocybe pediades]
MDSFARKPRWVSKSTQRTLWLDDVLSSQEANRSMRQKWYAARDVLDAIENIQRGWLGIPEACEFLSKLFLEKPLAIHVFTILLPDDLHLNQNRVTDGFIHHAATDRLLQRLPALRDMFPNLDSLTTMPTISSSSHLDKFIYPRLESPLPLHCHLSFLTRI